jgi:hypothetical protein
MEFFLFSLKKRISRQIFRCGPSGNFPSRRSSAFQLPALATLNYDTGRIRKAIVLGSLIPLVAEVGWAALGICLVERGAMFVDPVDVLLAASPVQWQLLILAIAAISTTIIGSFFALQSVFDDVLEGAKPKSTPTNPQQQGRAAPDGSGAPREGAPPTSWKDTRWKRRLVAAGMISIPSMAIASTSPTVFLSAIDFAGSYPVVLLWGLTPPLLALRLRKARRRSEPSSSAPVAPPVSSAGPDAWLRLLALVSGLSLAHTFIHSFIHSYIHTYLHAYMHTYIHIDIDIYR